jgi:hypothetical protein
LPSLGRSQLFPEEGLHHTVGGWVKPQLLCLKVLELSFNFGIGVTGEEDFDFGGHFQNEFDQDIKEIHDILVLIQGIKNDNHG